MIGLIGLKVAALGGRFALTFLSDGFSIFKGILFNLHPKIIALNLSLLRTRAISIGSAAAGWGKSLLSFAGTAIPKVIAGIRAFSLSAIAGIRAVSIAMFTTPIGWIIMGIAALVGAGYLLWKNWDKVSKGIGAVWGWLKTNWQKLLNIFLRVNPITFPIMALNKLVKFMSSINLFGAGKKILQTLYQGMMSMINKPVGALKGLAQKLRNLLPFSPAKEGPLRDLNRVNIIGTIAGTMKPDPMVDAMINATEKTKKAMSPVKMRLMQQRTQEVLEQSHRIKQVVEPVPPLNSPLIKGGHNSPLIKGGQRGVLSKPHGSGKAIYLNYRPVIHISGQVSGKDKDDFLQLLKQHRDDIIRMLKNEDRRDERVVWA
ncbi:MAG: hypothetical protein HY754_15750 [Nitrospirae bacterium]|nr:hypothetical protein [Nitrospirota bacterium]